MSLSFSNNQDYTRNQSETSSQSVIPDVASGFNPGLAELQFTPLQPQSLQLQALQGLTTELDQIRMSPPIEGRWEEICSSFIQEVLSSVSASMETSGSSSKGRLDVSGGVFGMEEVETTIHSLKAIASASTEAPNTIPSELRVSLQSLGSLAETIRSSWSSLVEELGGGLELKLASGHIPISNLPDLLSSITTFQNKVDEVAYGLASREALTDQLRKTLGTLGQTIHQSLIKLSGREVYVFAGA